MIQSGINRGYNVCNGVKKRSRMSSFVYQEDQHSLNYRILLDNWHCKSVNTYSFNWFTLPTFSFLTKFKQIEDIFMQLTEHLLLTNEYIFIHFLFDSPVMRVLQLQFIFIFPFLMLRGHILPYICWILMTAGFCSPALMFKRSARSALKAQICFLHWRTLHINLLQTYDMETLDIFRLMPLCKPMG